MGKVERRLVADGESFTIECAVRTDQTSPVAEALDQLAAGKWPVEDNSDGLDRLDRQVSVRDGFLSAMRHLSQYGTLPPGTHYNVLLDGIWEFKRLRMRLTYYDTDGRGSHEPVYVEKGHWRNTPWPMNDYDDYLRLTTAFEKTTAQTPQHEIDLAKQVREEDLEHDRQ